MRAEETVTRHECKDMYESGMITQEVGKCGNRVRV